MTAVRLLATILSLGPSDDEIADSAFEYARVPAAVTIPSGIRRIGVRAFFGCGELTSLTVSPGVRRIGRHAFAFCRGLKSVTIPEGVAEIGEGAFSGCSELESVTIPPGVTNIGARAFAGCTRLRTLNVPTGLERVGKESFVRCGALEEVFSPDLRSWLAISFADGAANPLAGGARMLVASDVHRREGWFDAGIGDYADWPADGSDRRVAEAGTWRGTASATLDASAGAGQSFLSLGDGTTLAFAPDEPMDCRSRQLVCRTRVTLDLDELDPFPPEVDRDMKGGLTVVGDNGSPAFYGIVRDGARDGNAFVRFDGVTPRPGGAVDIEVMLRMTDGGPQVCYAVDGTALTSGGEAWNPIVLSDETVRTLTLAGPGCEIRALSGAFDRNEPKDDVTDWVVGETQTSAVPVPHAWLTGYGLGLPPDDFESAACALSGKRDASGRALHVWEDYVAGTDPTDEESVFRAFIEMENGVPRISWSPDLNEGGARHVRDYRVLGAADLNGGWQEVDGDENCYNFFRVSVELPAEVR